MTCTECCDPHNVFLYLQEKAAQGRVFMYSNISHFLRNNLADEQGGSFPSALVWRVSLILDSYWEWRVGL